MVGTKVFRKEDNFPQLVFVALANISAGTELLYDYGEDNPEVIASNPWLGDS
jgi:hypothetical protein